MASIMNDAEIMGAVTRVTKPEMLEKIGEGDGEDIFEQVSEDEAGTYEVDPQNRRLLIIGCGDGGCNVASEISKLIPDNTHTIAYNTSGRNMANIAAQIKLIPKTEDGAGKVREYSKEVFRDYAYRSLLQHVRNLTEKMKDIAYIVICTTTDGGTGSGMSPMLAKIISDNVSTPVIVCGIYPSMSEDATAQFNALQWEGEIKKVGVPYFTFDNNEADGNSKKECHDNVNKAIARLMSLIAGCEYGNSDISMIDSRNLLMLLSQTGGRLVGAVSDGRLTAGQTLDNYIDEMLHRNYQPLPSGVRGIGVFVKGSADMLSKIDTDVPELQKKYGNALLHFAHIEESTDTEVAILMTGCSEASQRLTQMEARYNDIIQAQKEKTSVLDDVLNRVSNPLGPIQTKRPAKTGNESREIDLSGLEL